MQYTEKLNLPILEGTDSMSNLATQGNAIANQLETIVGANIENIEAVPELFNTVTEQGNDIEALEGRVELLEEVQTKETVIIDGEERVLTKVTAKLSATSTGNVNTVVFKSTEDDDDHRHNLIVEYATLIVDLTDTLDVRDESNILLKSATTYQNGYEYMAERNNMPFDVVALGKLQNDTNVKLIMANRYTSLLRQTRSSVGGVEVWSPGHQPPYAYNEEVIVVVEYFKLT